MTKTQTAAQATAQATAQDRSAERPPVWDLSDLFASEAALQQALEQAGREAADFAARYEGKTAALDGAGLAAAVQGYERIDESLSRASAYGQLLHAAQVSDPEAGRLAQKIDEAVTDISAQLVFFTLELNAIDETSLEEALKNKNLARYQSWIREIRLYRKHQLSHEVEKILHERAVTGRSAWIRLFDETMAALRFPVDGKMLNQSEVSTLMIGKDADLRRKAAQALGQVLQQNIHIFSLVTNTLAKDKAIDDAQRNFLHPLAQRNLSNQVEDDVVEALSSAVKNSFPRLSHRYYAFKARWMGQDKLPYWDRNAPLPESDDRHIPWREAQDIVLSAYGDFSPRLADIGRQFFDKPWIDAEPRDGKDSGAFSHPTVPSAHPYILMNYHGKLDNVMTLAHELGHGVHQVLAAGQGHFLSHTPLTLAETASVFGEMLTFRALLARERDVVRRRVMLASKIEDMLNTVVRQIAFLEFERQVHTERQTGELVPERLCDIWMEISRESLGPALMFDDHYRVYWAYIPHFIHSPFYVYAYAFGDCLVNALYGRYQENPQGFAEKYLDLLAAGGSKRHFELLAPFGLDARQPAFWQKGLDVIAGLMDELEDISSASRRA